MSATSLELEEESQLDCGELCSSRFLVHIAPGERPRDFPNTDIQRVRMLITHGCSADGPSLVLGRGGNGTMEDTDTVVASRP